jgi:DNA-binding MarR family transcriptional regulator
MEKTLDEILMGKLHEIRRMNRPHHGPSHERMHCEHGPHDHPRPPHGKGHAFLQRERILTVLLDHENGMNQKEILEEVKVNPSSLSEFIDKLEAERYVERTVDPNDKRATLIRLTDKGRARAYEVQDQRKEHAAKMFSGLTEDEKKQLLVLLDKIIGTKE